MQLNWTIISYILIGLLAISGYQRGWWKEAITTIFLVFLVALLTVPEFAQFLIETINQFVAFIWEVLPQSVKEILGNFLENVLGLNTSDGLFQFNSGDGGAWLMFLVLLLGISVLVGRLGLFDGIKQGQAYSVYVPTLLGRVTGGLLGGLNALILLDLVREYLDGRFLPANLFSELAMAGNSRVQVASGGVAARVTDLPSFTFLDSPLAWIFIVFSLILLVIVVKSKNLRADQVPYGYKRWQIVKEKEATKVILITSKK